MKEVVSQVLASSKEKATVVKADLIHPGTTNGAEEKATSDAVDVSSPPSSGTPSAVPLPIASPKIIPQANRGPRSVRGSLEAGSWISTGSHTADDFLDAQETLDSRSSSLSSSPAVAFSYGSRDESSGLGLLLSASNVVPRHGSVTGGIARSLKEATAHGAGSSIETESEVLLEGEGFPSTSSSEEPSEDVLRLPASAMVNQTRLPRRTTSLTAILGPSSSDIKVDGRKVVLNPEQLESIEGTFADMEDKCAQLQAALGSRSKETEGMRAAVGQVMQFLREERAAYGTALKNVKESLHRSREERRHRLKRMSRSRGRSAQSSSRTTPTLASSGNTPILSGASTPLGHALSMAGPEPMALAGPQPLMALPAPGPAPGHMPGPSAANQALALRPDPSMRSRAGPQPPGVRPPSNALVMRGPRDVELSGRMGGSSGQGGPGAYGAISSQGAGGSSALWQPEGLLMPLDEYQTLESRRDRSRQVGSCFMGMPTVHMAGRRPGQKVNRQQRWVVDSSWMEALRKEFMDLNSKLLDAVEQNEELRQILADKDVLEEKILELIETKQRHDDELDELMTKVAQMRTDDSPESPFRTAQLEAFHSTTS